MTLEKFTHPLIIVSAVAGLWILLRRPSETVSTIREFSGFDPGRWNGEGIAEVSQYLARPAWGTDPGYVHSAFRNPWQSDPSEDVVVTDMIGSGGENVPSYMDYNMNAPNTSVLLNPPKDTHGDCGCGGSCCESKCGSDCQYGVSLNGGHGSCLVPETGLDIPMGHFGIPLWDDSGNMYYPV